jgi:uncharacterized protein YjbI with pentapeptide repeats
MSWCLFREAKLKNCIVKGSKFELSNFSDSVLFEMTCTKSNFKNVDFNRAIIYKSHIAGCDFSMSRGTSFVV